MQYSKNPNCPKCRLMLLNVSQTDARLMSDVDTRWFIRAHLCLARFSSGLRDPSKYMLMLCFMRSLSSCFVTCCCNSKMSSSSRSLALKISMFRFCCHATEAAKAMYLTKGDFRNKHLYRIFAVPAYMCIRVNRHRDIKERKNASMKAAMQVERWKPRRKMLNEAKSARRSIHQEAERTGHRQPDAHENSDTDSLPHPILPVPRARQPSHLSYSQYVNRYGFYIDEITQYVLNGLPSQTSSGQEIAWNAYELRDALTRLCFDTSVNKHRRYSAVL